MSRLPVFAGAGNAFALVDAISGAPPADAPALARALCRPRAGAPRLDGLLIALRGQRPGAVRMVVVNADGSASETCGNGLRCVAKLVRERGHVAQDRFVIEDGAGEHPTVVRVESGRVLSARIGMGRPRVVTEDEAVECELGARRERLRGARVDVGNPHFVTVVADERSAPVTTLGPLVERHAAFPRGTNVEFLAARDGGLHLRIWERGVGETQACGSGACAAALVAVQRGMAAFPVRLRVPGGELVVHAGPDGSVELEGPVEELGAVEVPGGAARAG